MWEVRSLRKILVVDDEQNIRQIILKYAKFMMRRKHQMVLRQWICAEKMIMT